jgi:hypothetical protein
MTSCRLRRLRCSKLVMRANISLSAQESLEDFESTSFITYVSLLLDGISLQRNHAVNLTWLGKPVILLVGV